MTSCSSLENEAIVCPKITSPKKAAEIIVNSNNKSKVYAGIRGVQSYCTISSKDIEMDVSVNIRVIRKKMTNEDYAPITISIVSVDEESKEYDRDEFSYSQFLLKGSKIIDRSTKMSLNVPNKGQVYLGIK
jgi:hypothetical protein